MVRRFCVCGDTSMGSGCAMSGSRKECFGGMRDESVVVVVVVGVRKRRMFRLRLGCRCWSCARTRPPHVAQVLLW